MEYIQFLQLFYKYPYLQTAYTGTIIFITFGVCKFLAQNKLANAELHLAEIKEIESDIIISNYNVTYNCCTYLSDLYSLYTRLGEIDKINETALHFREHFMALKLLSKQHGFLIDIDPVPLPNDIECIEYLSKLGNYLEKLSQKIRK